MAALKELYVHVLCGDETKIISCKRSDFTKVVQERFNIDGDIEIFDRKTSRKLTVETMKPVCSVEVTTSGTHRVSIYIRDVIIDKLKQKLPLTDKETFSAISLLQSNVNSNNAVYKKNAKIQVKLTTQDQQCQTDEMSVEPPAKRKIKSDDLKYQCKRLASTEKVDSKKVKELMDKLFDERRDYILLEAPLAAVVKEKYPLLFSLGEVKNEIDRIFHQGKCQDFLNNIEKYAKYILNSVRDDHPLLLFTKKKIKSYNTPVQKNYAMKVGSVLILTSIMNEERKFLKLIDQPTEISNFPYIEAQAKFSQIFFDEHIFKVYVEGYLLCEASDFLEAILCLIGSYYIFNIKYPDFNWNTFVVFEQIYLGRADTEDLDEYTTQIIRNLQLKVQGSVNNIRN